MSELTDALCLAQQKMENPKNDMRAEIHGREYTYASLAAIEDVVRPALNSVGIFYSQPVLKDGDLEYVTTIVAKGDEERTLGCMALPAGLLGQDKGALVTYWRKQQATAAFGLAGDADIDGATAATGAPGKTQKQQEYGGMMALAKTCGINIADIKAWFKQTHGREMQHLTDAEMDETIEHVRQLIEATQDQGEQEPELAQEDIPF